jgi:toxin FitB
LEVLGFHRLDNSDKIYFETIFNNIKNFSITKNVIDSAISLRQSQKMSIGDAIIAETALSEGFELFTRNIINFVSFSGVKVVNPV